MEGERRPSVSSRRGEARVLRLEVVQVRPWVWDRNQGFSGGCRGDLSGAEEVDDVVIDDEDADRRDVGRDEDIGEG